jgi:hypothetical protein
MPLQPECDLGLALSAEANDLVQILIRLRIYSMGKGRQDHLGALLQNRARLNLVHEAAFTFKRFTYLASHSHLLSPILFRRQGVVLALRQDVSRARLGQVTKLHRKLTLL